MAETDIMSGAFDFLIKIGFLNILVPFILFYAIIFGMLEKAQVFSRNKDEPTEDIRNLHSLIAFAISVTATGAANAVGITQNYLPILAVLSVILLGAMMLLSMAFGDQFETIQKGKTFTAIAWTFALLLIISGFSVIAYTSGLIVKTPCSMFNQDLTPVNMRDVSSGQCTQFLDITDNGFYLMGFNTSNFLTQDVVYSMLGIGLFLGVIFGVIYLTKKQ